MTWPMGLRRRPVRTRSLEGGAVRDDAPAGATQREGRPHDGRQADVLQGACRGRCPGHLVGALDDGRRGIGLADAIEQVAEPFAVLGHLDRLDGRPQQTRPGALQDAGPCHLHGQVEAGLTAQAGQQALRPLPFQDALHGGDRERLEVDDVGDAGVGHDRGRVGVEEDGAHALLAQGPAGLRAGVVELGGLADDDGAGAQDEDRRGRLHPLLRPHPLLRQRPILR